MTLEQYQSLRSGDIVKYKGRHRPVLFVYRRGIAFPILRCSWTRRPYTCVSKHEAMRYGEIVGARMKNANTDFAVALWESSRRQDTRQRYVCGSGITALGEKELNLAIEYAEEQLR